MASIDYEDIFSYFLGDIRDYDFLSMDDDEANEIMIEQLRKALSKSYLRRLFSSIKINDTRESITYEMKYVVDSDADRDFVLDVLAKAMVIEWLSPQVRNKTNISQMFATKEQTFFSQATHLGQLRSLLEDTQKELRDQIRDRGYIYNNYLTSDK